MQSIRRLLPGRALAAAFVIAIACCPGSVVSAQTSEQTSEPKLDVVEQGKFRLHKFEQPIGEETYQITRDADALVVKMDFKFTDRGSEVPLAATFRSAQDLTPREFEIKGKPARPVEIDQTVEIHDDKVRLRNRTQWSDAPPPPKTFFTIAGYAPATMQMLLVRYWATHGSPAELPTLPKGTVKIEPRGHDVIAVNGKDETLDRYIVEGLIWGREALWFDARHNLAPSRIPADENLQLGEIGGGESGGRRGASAGHDCDRTCSQWPERFSGY
jgi:hypothetical protein